MKEVQCNFYELDFYDSFLGEPQIVANTMTIEARDVILLAGLLFKSKMVVVPIAQCELYFEGVQRSEKKIYEYIGNPADGRFAEPYTVFDGPFEQTGSNPEHFEMEGVIMQPKAWIAWNIEAASFRLRVPENTAIPEM